MGAILHTEVVQPSLLIALAVAAALLGAVMAVGAYRSHRKQMLRNDRIRKLIAYERAWNWLKGKRTIRLTDQRPTDE